MKDLRIVMATKEHAQDIFDIMMKTSDETSFLMVNSKERLDSGFNLESVEKMLESFEEKGNLDRQFLLEYKGKIVGVSGIHRVTPKRGRLNHKASFGICILKDYWGLGGGELLISSVIKYFRETPEFTRLELEVMEANQRAFKLYEKLGFEVEGKIRKFALIDGKYTDGYIMSIVK